MNKVMVHGRLTRDPETRAAGNSTVCKFSVAENQRFDREKQISTIAKRGGKTGEFVEKILPKRTRNCSFGELRQEEFTAKDGTNRRVWKINVDHVDFCGKANDNAGGQAPAYAPGPAAPKFEELAVDDDLPF